MPKVVASLAQGLPPTRQPPDNQQKQDMNANNKIKAILTEKNGKKTIKRTKIMLNDEFKNNPNLETIEVCGLFFERSQFDTLCLNTAHLRRD